MNPKVATWCVSWWRGPARLDVAYVQAPTKTLARLAIAFDHVDLILRNRNAVSRHLPGCLRSVVATLNSSAGPRAPARLKRNDPNPHRGGGSWSCASTSTRTFT
jgi:hypothetical protein